MSLERVYFSDEVIKQFYEIYGNDRENLKKLPPILLALGLNYMDIILLTKQELGLGLAEILNLLKLPDALI